MIIEMDVSTARGGSTMRKLKLAVVTAALALPLYLPALSEAARYWGKAG